MDNPFIHFIRPVKHIARICIFGSLAFEEGSKWSLKTQCKKKKLSWDKNNVLHVDKYFFEYPKDPLKAWKKSFNRIPYFLKAEKINMYF